MIRTTHLPHIILLQGPPQCGKDTIAKLLDDFGRYNRMKFAAPLIKAMEGAFAGYFTTPTGHPRTIEDFKRHNFGHFLSADDRVVTGRDMMIAYSEKFMKPLFGEEVFGRWLERASLMVDGPIVISDSGFEAEAQPVFKTYGKKHCVIIQIWRPTKTFEGDSRNYWTDPEVATCSYNNALEDLDAMKIDFIKWFNTNVFSLADAALIRSKENG